MADEEEEKIYKVVLIGESGIGKTCIISQFINNTFDSEQVTSSTAQFKRKVMEFADGKKLTFDVWDTAGQERYRSMTRNFYKDAEVAILVYDITDPKSFEEMKNYWYKQIQEYGLKDVIYAVAANKSDLYEEQQVKDEEGEEFAKSIKAIFSSTSAKNDSGIQALFDNIAQKILNPNFDFAENEEKKKKEYKEKKLKETKPINQSIPTTKSMKLKKPTNNDTNEKKKKCC